MDNSYKEKIIEELELIIQGSPPESGIYQAAKKEIKRREFWRKEIITWVSLGLAICSIVIHILRYYTSK